MRLEDPTIRQLKQRVTLRCELQPFELTNTAAYIASRIATAGGDASQIFTRDAVVLIHDYSGGIPRSVNVICDNALVSGMAMGRRRIDRALIVEIGRDLHLGLSRQRSTHHDPSSGVNDWSGPMRPATLLHPVSRTSSE